jgi:pimeloyl-ACP methyl ester carboxylesterase
MRRTLSVSAALFGTDAGCFAGHGVEPTEHGSRSLCTPAAVAATPAVGGDGPALSWVQQHDVPLGDVTIRVVTGGTGSPLLLLHGLPETHVTWHKISGSLARDHTLVIPDLRGYGDSSKPDGGDGHANYSFRSMARDQVELMRHFGFSSFSVAGHDRGGRVAHRLCLDHPDAVRAVALLDIAPTLTMYNDTNKEFATQYMWWFFLIQPYPLPEHLFGLDPAFFIRHLLEVLSKTPGAVTPAALQEYLRCLRATGITWMALRGDNPLTIKQRAGHRRFETTEGYIREAENLRAANPGVPFPALPACLLGSGQVLATASFAGLMKPKASVFLAERAGFEPAAGF